MAFRIAPTGPIAPFGRQTKAVKREDYRRWIASLPCIVSRQRGCQAAHVSFARPDLGHFGRGKSQKASDRWILPMAPSLHTAQHLMREEAFWKRYEVDPHLACLVLFGLWSDYNADATEHAERLIMAGIGRNRKDDR